MWLIILILMAIAISALFSLFENNPITRTVINCRDGPPWTSELPLVSENLIKMMKMRSFFQYPLQYIGKNTMIISKKFVDIMTRLKFEVRNNLRRVNRSTYLGYYSFSKC